MARESTGFAWGARGLWVNADPRTPSNSARLSRGTAGPGHLSTIAGGGEPAGGGPSRQEGVSQALDACARREAMHVPGQSR